ncbi:MAG: DUF4397 domain-containing protein [Armatimonadetes bacterium]|nr:DUF4397 domain-containing protein [Armatimonadota bacterium]
MVNLCADLPSITLRVDGQDLLSEAKSSQLAVDYQRASRQFDVNPGPHHIEVLADGLSVLNYTQTWAEGRHACLQVLGRINTLVAGDSVTWLAVQRSTTPDADHAGIRVSHALAGYGPVDVEVEPAAGSPVPVAAALAYGAASANEPLLVPHGAVRLRIRQGETLIWDQSYQVDAMTVYNFALSGALQAPTVVTWSGA